MYARIFLRKGENFPLVALSTLLPVCRSVFLRPIPSRQRFQNIPDIPDDTYDGQDDGNRIGANVRTALETKGHLPQPLTKHHGDFFEYWIVAVWDIYSVGYT